MGCCEGAMGSPLSSWVGSGWGRSCGKGRGEGRTRRKEEGRGREGRRETGGRGGVGAGQLSLVSRSRTRWGWQTLDPFSRHSTPERARKHQLALETGPGRDQLCDGPRVARDGKLSGWTGEDRSPPDRARPRAVAGGLPSFPPHTGLPLSLDAPYPPGSGGTLHEGPRRRPSCRRSWSRQGSTHGLGRAEL